MQTGTDPASLSNLRDIVEPPPVSWWPPAPGWYVVLVLGLAAVCVGAYVWVRRWRADWYRRAALVELREISSDRPRLDAPAQVLCAIQELLKRTALVAFPREQVAALSGTAWLHFLDRTAGMQEFAAGAGRHLIDAVYAPDSTALTDDDVDSVVRLSHDWIQQHRAPREST